LFFIIDVKLAAKADFYEINETKGKKTATK